MATIFNSTTAEAKERIKIEIALLNQFKDFNNVIKIIESFEI
jgi:hypothetical protein